MASEAEPICRGRSQSVLRPESGTRDLSRRSDDWEVSALGTLKKRVSRRTDWVCDEGLSMYSIAPDVSATHIPAIQRRVSSSGNRSMSP
jgi:hypothetical protein